MNLPNELWGQRIFTENFLNSNRSRTGEAWVVGLSSYPLDHEVVVERIILELPDIMRWRNRNRKFYKSKSLTGIEREWPFKNNYKFFGGNLVLQHLHPVTCTLFSSKNSQLFITIIILKSFFSPFFLHPFFLFFPTL